MFLHFPPSFFFFSSSFFISKVTVIVKTANKCQCYREGYILGRKMGPGQGGSRSDRGWEEGNNMGGNWARAREGPRTISPKKREVSFRPENSIFIKVR